MLSLLISFVGSVLLLVAVVRAFDERLERVRSSFTDTLFGAGMACFLPRHAPGHRSLTWGMGHRPMLVSPRDVPHAHRAPCHQRAPGNHARGRCALPGATEHPRHCPGLPRGAALAPLRPSLVLEKPVLARQRTGRKKGPDGPWCMIPVCRIAYAILHFYTSCLLTEVLKKAAAGPRNVCLHGVWSIPGTPLTHAADSKYVCVECQL